MKTLRTLLLSVFALMLAVSAAPAQQQNDIYCSQSAQYDASTNGSTRIFTAVPTSPRQVFVCGLIINVGATATNVQFKYGTGTNCGDAGSVNMTPNWVLPIAGQLYDELGVFHGILVPAGKDICIVTSAGNPVQAMLFYTYQ